MNLELELARLQKLKALSVQNFHTAYYASLATIPPSILSFTVQQAIAEKAKENEVVKPSEPVESCNVAVKAKGRKAVNTGKKEVRKTNNTHNTDTSNKTKAEIEAEIFALKQKLALLAQK